MLLLAAYGGPRCCELANLDAANVDVEHRRRFVVGKGKRERVVPLHPEAWDALEGWGCPATAGCSSGPAARATGRAWPPPTSRPMGRWRWCGWWGVRRHSGREGTGPPRRGVASLAEGFLTGPEDKLSRFPFVHSDRSPAMSDTPTPARSVFRVVRVEPQTDVDALKSFRAVREPGGLADQLEAARRH